MAENLRRISLTKKFKLSISVLLTNIPSDLFQKMNFKILFYFTLLFLTTKNSAFASGIADNIKIYVYVVNDKNGNELKDIDVKVTNSKTKVSYKLTREKGESFYMVPGDAELKIEVIAKGFYKEEIIKSDLRDEENIEIRLSPRPSGVLAIRVIDAQSRDAIDANIEVTFFNQNSKGVVKKEDGTSYDYFYDLKGKYSLKVTSKDFLNDVREMSLDISDEQLRTELLVEMVRNRLEQKISFFDKATNIKVNVGKVVVKHLDTKQNVFEGKIENGKVTFVGNRDDKYSLVTDIPGFQSESQEFKLDGKDLTYGLTPETTIEIDIIDELDEKRIITDLTITDPSGKEIKIKSSDKGAVKFTPKTIGTYQISSISKDYANKSGTFIVKSLSGGSTFYNLRLKKGSNEFIISVFDDETKKPINFAIVKVFNNQSREIAGKVNQNTKTVTLDESQKFFYEVSAKGYFDFTANVATEKNITVYLKKKTEAQLNKVTIRILDQQTLKPISDAKIRIFENNKKAIPVSYLPDSQTFFTEKINDDSLYTIEINANGYINQNQSLQRGNRDVVFNLSPTELVKYNFVPVDFFTQKTLDADLKLLASDVSIELEKVEKGFTGFLSNTQNYSVLVNKEGFSELKKVIDKREANAKTFVFPLKKNFYDIEFKFDHDLNKSSKNEIIIKEKTSGKSQKLKIDEGTQTFTAQIVPEESYLISAKLEGFDFNSFSFTLNQANAESLVYVIKINPISKKEEDERPRKLVKVAEEAPAPKITNVEMQKKPEPVKEAPLEIKQGEKYELAGVSFEKSKPTLTPGSEGELDKLADYLTTHPELKILITGHTDDDGDDVRLNQRLSLFRAKLVSNYLFNKGVAPERIEIKGKGATEPLVPNDSEENKAKNRRIEVTVFKD